MLLIIVSVFISGISYNTPPYLKHQLLSNKTKADRLKVSLSQEIKLDQGF